ncbi:hypothetical protein BS17DRAFT_849161 [Gyrodon lividus]|nr:hypothetical protein BS17DRAFT_849161 [Gyrodon lividus]
MANPNAEIRPDFTSGAFRAIREAVMAAENVDQDTAIEHLLTAWQEDHDRRVEEWNAQQQAEAQEAGRQENERQARREEAQMQAEGQIEIERREAERKKPKMNNFTSGLAPP